MKKILVPLMVLICFLTLAPITSFAQEYNALSVEKPSQEEIAKFVKSHPVVTDSDKIAYIIQPSISDPYLPGLLTDATMQNSLNQINVLRYVAGLNADITLNAEYNKKAQAGSLINAINKNLNHYPTQPAGMDNALFELGYSGTSSSNIGSGHSGLLESIMGQMHDISSDKNLSAVGHRRWLLNPRMQQTGFGYVSRYSCVYAVDKSNPQPNNTATVAWPAMNMPINLMNQLTPFSLSLSTNFMVPVRDNISITMTRKRDNKSWVFNKNSSSVPSNDGYFIVDRSGYGQSKCLIWRPSLGDTQPLYQSGDKFTVTIDGLYANKEPYPLQYDVDFFDLNNSNSSAYTVHFDSNGATEGTMKDISLFYGEKAAIPTVNFKRSGYQFEGWSLTPNGTVAYKNSETIQNLTNQNQATVTLYAIWKQQTYNIKFDANGGKGTMKDLPMKYNYRVNLPSNSFTRKGYSFIGWSATKNGTKKYQDRASIVNLTTIHAKNITLYAVWQASATNPTPKKYLIRFNANGGKGKMASFSMTYGSTKKLSANKFTRKGYKFLGWAKTSRGSIAYKNAQSIKNLTSKDKGTVNLYAKWSRLSRYTIKFSANGGKGKMTSPSMTYGSYRALPANRFTRKGYTFKGWAKSPRGKVVYKNKKSIKNLTTKNKGTVVLYAKWEKKKRQ